MQGSDHLPQINISLRRIFFHNAKNSKELLGWSNEKLQGKYSTTKVQLMSLDMYIAKVKNICESLDLDV